MLKISMIDANDFVETAVLDGSTYKLHFAWNSYAEAWSLDIRDSTGTDIVRGISVVPNFPLFNQHRRHGLPRGEMMAIVVNQSATDGQTIGRDDFVSGKASIVYIPRSELDDIMEATV